VRATFDDRKSEHTDAEIAAAERNRKQWGALLSRDARMSEHFTALTTAASEAAEG